MLKRLGRSAVVQEAAGSLLAGYIRLVRATNRWTFDPPDLHDRLVPELPVIVALWHGQHLMVPAMKRGDMPARTLASRHADGGVNAIACARFGIGAVRGSGGSARKSARRGGAQALRAMLDVLAKGESMVFTADVPKVSGRAGEGVALLAKLSGRPVFPFAVATSRIKTLDTWDHAAINLPFGRGAAVLGDPVRVERDAGPEALERARLAIEAGLDAAHERAYLAVGMQWTRRGASRAAAEASPHA
ncbi:lysophospholipid acyltransferase family protein [Methylopila turkensis]|uniref:DUF374 domain-containing protein n=1 Tax=Methylopila turkensis TaxID=1437816 RepID=A0A9W6JJD7_9HYPH|nr:lysophospholipid acyltransferase family protein [Methylopila turkensis]GLK78735.1 hypothetical protein GCM10008174_04760 [Methylopila turkensis]